MHVCIRLNGKILVMCQHASEVEANEIITWRNVRMKPLPLVTTMIKSMTEPVMPLRLKTAIINLLHKIS